ncbi:Crp/Fnr family transcriptional regulator [Listeria booriae]|uniref:Crp/Fnr family transcriptional regulator n=1 Tax=Listeria booriae TaxID=1552123 RepID=UPI001627703E|nr:Crp/Fnr family transcriptional regulator [Listeria booriae]MBC1286732.1 Crp/Fnr family transcriptional regulator [Listeria booriae]
MISEIEDLYSIENVESEFNQQSLIKLLTQSSRVTYEYRKLRKRTLIDPILTNEIYFLTSGAIIATNEDFPTSVKKTDEFIGLDTIILQSESTISYRTIVECEVIVFQKEEVLMELFSQQEGWLFLILEMQQQNRLLMNRCFSMRGNSISRLSATFYELATRFGTKQGDVYILPKYFNKKFIAEYSGLSTSSVTKTEVVLKKEGLIEFSDKVYIVSLDRYNQLQNLFT